MRKLFIGAAAMYALTVLFTMFCFPQAIYPLILGAPSSSFTLGKNGQESHEESVMRYCYRIQNVNRD